MSYLRAGSGGKWRRMRSPSKYNGRVVGCLALGALTLLLVFSTSGTSDASQDTPRSAEQTPDLSGFWQAVGDYHRNIEPHAAVHAQRDTAGSTTRRSSITEAGEIPYTAAAREQQRENALHWAERDPAIRCNAPGIPRATYMPYAFQIEQNEDHITFAYGFAEARRMVHMNRDNYQTPDHDEMGTSRGRWDGDTLVIDVTSQVPDTWLDSSGNHHSSRMHVVERYISD